MRLLFIILDGWPTFRPDVTALWGDFLLRQGVHADLCTQSTAPAGERPDWPAGEAWICEQGGGKVSGFVRGFFHDLKVLWRTRHADHDAVIVRDKSFIALPALWWARYRGRPFFYWMSFPIAESLVRLQARIEFRREPLRWLYLGWRGHVGGWLLRRLVLPHADHLFVQSQRMVEDLAVLGLDPKQMTPVPMCISPARFPAPLPRVPRTDGQRVVGYLGECSRVRRIDFLFEALAIARQQLPDLMMLVVGDAYEASDQQWLRDEIARLGLQGHVRITGWMPAEQVSAAFAEVDVALALMAPDPLLDSTTPTKLVEYLAMGRAVVANDHPDQRQVLVASGAGLCTEFRPEAYAAAMVELLKDPERAQSMAERGRKWVLQERAYDQCAVWLAAELRSRACRPIK